MKKTIIASILMVACAQAAAAQHTFYTGCYKLEVPLSDKIFIDYLRVDELASDRPGKIQEVSGTYFVPGSFESQSKGSVFFTGPWGSFYTLNFLFNAVEAGKKLQFELSIIKFKFSEDIKGQIKFEGDENSISFKGSRLSNATDAHCSQ